MCAKLIFGSILGLLYVVFLPIVGLAMLAYLIFKKLYNSYPHTI